MNKQLALVFFYCNLSFQRECATICRERSLRLSLHRNRGKKTSKMEERRGGEPGHRRLQRKRMLDEEPSKELGTCAESSIFLEGEGYRRIVEQRYRPSGSV